MPLNDESFRNLQISIEDLTRAAKDWTAAIQRSGSAQGGGTGGAGGGPAVPGSTATSVAANAAIAAGTAAAGSPGSSGSNAFATTASVAARLMAVGGGNNAMANVLQGFATGGPVGGGVAVAAEGLKYMSQRRQESLDVNKAGLEAFYGRPLDEPEAIGRERQKIAEFEAGSQRYAEDQISQKERRGSASYGSESRQKAIDQIVEARRRTAAAMTANLDQDREVARIAEQRLEPFFRVGVKPPEALERHFVEQARRQVENNRTTRQDLYLLASKGDPLAPSAQGMRGKQ